MNAMHANPDAVDEMRRLYGQPPDFRGHTIDVEKVWQDRNALYDAPIFRHTKGENP